MKKTHKTLFFIFYFLFSFQLFSFSLSRNSQISVITISPSQKELYSAFGHSGIRIKDDSLGVDYFYNYGVFDFDQPNFYMNFLKGKLLYMISKYNYSSVEGYYIKNNQSMKEQILNLKLNQKEKIFQFLESNILDHNKYYYYNYIYNNCATKIRDLFEQVLPGYVKYEYELIPTDLSFRDLMDIYLIHQKWGDLGIDICLGTEIDKLSNGYSSMYLPDYLYINLKRARITNNKSFVIEENEIFKSKEELISSFWSSPISIFFLILIISIIISFRERKYNLWYKMFDFFLFLTTGSIGILLVYLWLSTDHLSSYNYNIIWALPFNFIISLLFINNKILKKIKYYFLIYSILLISLIFLWYFLPQTLNSSLIILVMLLISRSLLIFFQLNNLSIKN